MSGAFRAECDVEVAFDFDVDFGVAAYIDAKTWAYGQFGKDVRWRMIEQESRAIFSFARYPDALLFTMFIDGAVIRVASAA